MSKFTTTVKLTNKQAEALTRTIANMFSCHGPLPASFCFKRLLTLPIGAEVEWDEDSEGRRYRIYFIATMKSSSEKWILIRFEKHQAQVYDIVYAFLTAKSFGDFKRMIWKRQNYLIGNKINVEEGMVKKTYVKCHGCHKVHETEDMIKLTGFRSDEDTKGNYEYLCLDCEHEIYHDKDSNTDCHIIEIFQG